MKQLGFLFLGLILLVAELQAATKPTPALNSAKKIGVCYDPSNCSTTNAALGDPAPLHAGTLAFLTGYCAEQGVQCILNHGICPYGFVCLPQPAQIQCVEVTCGSSGAAS